MAEDYRGQHQAPDPEFGAPMHNLAGGIMPKDFYETMHHYRFTHERSEDRAMELMRWTRNRPNQRLPIYRAVPKDTPRGTKINPGDWVTPVRAYALQHGRSNLSNQFRVIEQYARAKDLYTSGDDWREWGYHPSSED